MKKQGPAARVTVGARASSSRIDFRPGVSDKPAANRVDAVSHGDSRFERSLGLYQPATVRNGTRRVNAFADVGPKLVPGSPARPETGRRCRQSRLRRWDASFKCC